MSPTQPALTVASTAKPIQPHVAPDDLWQEALKSLAAEDRQAINVNNPNKIAILQDILAITTEKKQLCLEKRWKYRRGDEEVILRDQLEKVIAWIEKFKAVGSAVIQYDPGHAALPWAGILFLLQIAVNDSQTFGAMVEGVELVSNVIARYAILEDLYLKKQPPSTMHDQLRTAIVKLYVSILRYLAKAKKYFDRNTAKRLVTSTVRSAEAGVFTYLSIISKKAANVDSCIHVLNAERSQELNARSRRLEELLLQLEQPINRSATQISELHDRLKRNDRAKVLTWLSVVPVTVHHKTTGEDYLQGSCSWIDRHPEFVRWRKSSSSSVLWLRGIPGSGKTKLIYYVIQRLLEENGRSTSPAPIAYFYCARNSAEPKRANPDEIMRSLLKQLASSGPDNAIRAPVVQSFEKKAEEADADITAPIQLTTSECVPVILEILDQNPATIIIDALDECDPTHRYKLISAISLILKQSASLVKVIIASRDDGDITCHLANTPNVYIRAEDNGDDIERFIHHSLAHALEAKRLLNGQMSNSLKTEVITTLMEGAGSMFRWVTLQIDNLCDSQRIKIEDDVRQEVGRLPKTLKESYDPLYRRVLNLARPSRILAERVFKWLLCAQKLMKFDELKAAITSASEYNELSVHNILDMCSNMVVVDDLGVFRFAHLSVREYLESHGTFSSRSSHSLALGRCLETYMNTSLEWDSRAYNEHDLTLKPYAMVYWPIHCQSSAGEAGKNEALGDMVEQFIFENCEPSTAFTDWVADAWSFSEYSGAISCNYALLQKLGSMACPSSTPFFLACCFDFPWILDKLAVSGYHEWAVQNQRGESGIYLAAKWRNSSVQQWLLTNAQVDPKDAAEALYAAVENQDEQTIDVLLRHKASGQLRTKAGETPLQLAARLKDTRTLRCILDVSVEFQPDAVAGALSAAYEHPSGEIFGLLRSWCLALNPSDYLSLILCIDSEDEDSEDELLLQHMLDEAKRQDSSNLSPIVRLATGNYLEMMHLRPDRTLGLYWNASSCPALFVAVYNVDETLTELLLSLGIDVNEKVDGTALHIAAGANQPRIASMLLAHGADIEAKDDKGRTPLILATKKGALAMVRVLQKNGANVEATDNKGRTALYLAVKKHEHLVLDFLLRVAGATPNVTSLDLDTPLMMGVGNKCYHCVRRLLRFNARVETTDRQGEQILHLAVASGSTPILELLLKSGVNRDSRHWLWGDTPLIYAISRQDEVSARLLLGASAATDAVDLVGRSALHYAVGVENEALVQVLIDHGVSQSARDANGQTPLHYAIVGDNIKILQLLLNSQPAVDAPDEDGNTALHWAVKGSRPSAYIDMLLTSGASVESLNKAGQMPRDLASEVGLDFTTMLSAEEEDQSEGQTHLQARKDRKSEYMSDSNEDSDTEYLGLIDFENSFTKSPARPVGSEDNPFFDEKTGTSPECPDQASFPWIASADPNRSPESSGLDPSIDYFSSHGVDNWSIIPSTKVVPLRPVGAIFRP